MILLTKVPLHMLLPLEDPDRVGLFDELSLLARYFLVGSAAEYTHISDSIDSIHRKYERASNPFF